VADWRAEEARNETVFREMNEWTEEADDARLGLERPMDAYLCECSDRRCAATIRVTRHEYEGVRASGVRFVIALECVACIGCWCAGRKCPMSVLCSA